MCNKNTSEPLFASLVKEARAAQNQTKPAPIEPEHVYKDVSIHLDMERSFTIVSEKEMRKLVWTGQSAKMALKSVPSLRFPTEDRKSEEEVFAFKDGEQPLRQAVIRVHLGNTWQRVLMPLKDHLFQGQGEEAVRMGPTSRAITHS